ncbi:hypothetical protein B6N60_02012 [Richelia sinica FACHB-800]|uniref:Uncharacterized protein n=1 Tax=Richelia sinica FACHB-800 TaxID=1357546 RepID=A0A975Y4M4_9NOST|nr:hypothetical protein B6N60_02012 [Richelia sinica FACHB-800]
MAIFIIYENRLINLDLYFQKSGAIFGYHRQSVQG